MLDFVIEFGYFCFYCLWLITIDWFKRNNYWMPTIYIASGIIFIVVTCCFIVAN